MNAGPSKINYPHMEKGKKRGEEVWIIEGELSWPGS